MTLRIRDQKISACKTHDELLTRRLHDQNISAPEACDQFITRKFGIRQFQLAKLTNNLLQEDFSLRNSLPSSSRKIFLIVCLLLCVAVPTKHPHCRAVDYHHWFARHYQSGIRKLSVLSTQWWKSGFQHGTLAKEWRYFNKLIVLSIVESMSSLLSIVESLSSQLIQVLKTPLKSMHKKIVVLQDQHWWPVNV